jgi:predicted  nucleic acid-binding Zn-ribbon protein
MPTVANLKRQKQQAEKQKREVDMLMGKERQLLHEHIAEIDKQIHELQSQRAKATADLNDFR